MCCDRLNVAAWVATLINPSLLVRFVQSSYALARVRARESVGLHCLLRIGMKGMKGRECISTHAFLVSLRQGEWWRLLTAPCLWHLFTCTTHTHTHTRCSFRSLHTGRVVENADCALPARWHHTHGDEYAWRASASTPSRNGACLLHKSEW